MRLAVSITVNDRPEYLGQVIESWHHVRGIDEVPVIFQVEPKSDQCFDMCLKAGFKKQLVQLNTTQRGALGNPYYAVESGFSVLTTEFVLLGEDDSVVTADALEFFDFAARSYRRHEKCLAVCSFEQMSLKQQANLIYPRHYFASVVWGTWRDRWGEVREQWSFDYLPAWDQMLLDMVKLTERYCAFPAISRSQHIGKYGTHMPVDQFEVMQAETVHDGSPQNYIAIGGDA